MEKYYNIEAPVPRQLSFKDKKLIDELMAPVLFTVQAIMLGSILINFFLAFSLQIVWKMLSSI